MPKETAKNYEEQLNKLIYLLKSHQLNTKPKTQVEEQGKRLKKDFNVVDGRKLDQSSVARRTVSKLFGQRPVGGQTEERRPKSAVIVAAKANEAPKEEVAAKSQPSDLQDKLKKFTFRFPKQDEANNEITVSLSLMNLIEIAQEGTKLNSKTDDDKDKKNKPQETGNKQQQQQQQRQPGYRQDFMYLVLDTNVLVETLYLLKDVANVRLSGTSGSVLYVPYIVIKELDTLKHRQGTSFAARRAIEYLNDKFDDQEAILAQSALEDSQQLIGIDCPDDNIVNCCLQVKAKVKHMMLLTNDNNLRLKARASAISVSTCYQLTTSLRANSWCLYRDRRQQRRPGFGCW